MDKLPSNFGLNLTVPAAIIGIGSGVSKIFSEFMNDIR